MKKKNPTHKLSKRDRFMLYEVRWFNTLAWLRRLEKDLEGPFYKWSCNDESCQETNCFMIDGHTGEWVKVQ